MIQINGSQMQTAATASTDTDSSARHTKLLHAAQQFEAVMLNELMKPLGKSAAIGEDGAQGEAGTLQSFGVEAMAGAMAKSGALGFARRIISSVEAHEKNFIETGKKFA